MLRWVLRNRNTIEERKTVSMRGFSQFGAVVMVVWCGCKANAGRTPAPDSPKAVALAYYDGIIEGDVAKTMATLDPRSERTRAAVHAGLVLGKAMMELDDACLAKFGKAMVGLRDEATTHRREVVEGEFRMEGDLATLALPSSPGKSFILKRTNAGWKLAEQTKKDPGVFMSASQFQKYESQAADIVRGVVSDVRAGKYSECQDAMMTASMRVADAQNAMMAADKNCEPVGFRQWRAFLSVGCVKAAYVCEHLTAQKVFQSMTEDEDEKQYVRDQGPAAAAAQLLNLVRNGREQAGCAPDPDTN